MSHEYYLLNYLTKIYHNGNITLKNLKNANYSDTRAFCFELLLNSSYQFARPRGLMVMTRDL